MSEFVYNPNISGRSTALLPSVFRTSERIHALVESAGDASQSVEDAGFDVLVGDSPKDGWGSVLDRWGRVVGQGRRGLTDLEYRVFLEARQMANIAGSDVDDIVEVWKHITDPGEQRYFKLPPAGYSLLVWRDQSMRPAYRERVVDLMDAIRPAGVELTMIEADQKTAAYRYDEGPGLDEGAFARTLR